MRVLGRLAELLGEQPPARLVDPVFKPLGGVVDVVGFVGGLLCQIAFPQPVCADEFGGALVSAAGESHESALAVQQAQRGKAPQRAAAGPEDAGKFFRCPLGGCADVFLDLPEMLEDVLAADADAFLTQHGIILRRMDAYGLPGCLRLTIGSEEANRAVITTLAAFLGKDAQAALP